MRLLSWLRLGSSRFVPSGTANRLTKRAPSARLSVELLEDRALPSGYTVTDLGSRIEGGSSQASNINASAQVVGWAYAGMGNEHAFLWQNGVMTDLGTLGGNVSRATAINDFGQVVGFSSLAGSTVAYRAFLVTPEDTDGDGTPDRWFRDSNADGANDLMRNLGTLGGSNPDSRASDVNNLGQVVGHSSWRGSNGGDVYRAFLWQNGAMSSLGTLGGNYSTAQAINDTGQITGMSVDTSGSTHAFLRTNGVMTDLGSSYGATDINNAGQLIDYFGLARLWTPTVPNGSTGTFASLGQLPLIDPYYYFSETYARGINGTGAVVGHHADYYLNGESAELIGYRATLWENGLVNELPLEFAEAINDHGQIVGNTGIRAYMLTPISLELPRASIRDVTFSEGNTGTRAATFTVTLSAASSQPVTVAYTTANGTATAGSDYQATSGTLTFAPGQSTRTITVLVNGDRLPEANETFFVNLSSSTNATIADGQGVGTILDDEPRVSISDVSKKEGKKNQTTLFSFTVTLSTAYDQPVTMSFRTANGTATTGDNDYVAKSGTLTFAPGEMTKTISIEVKGDSKREAHEYFYLDLFGNSSNSWFNKNRGIGSILNDD